MIYQLLKTSPYITGQVRLDIVADHLEGDQRILLDEVHVVPLNDSIWYNCPEDQINYMHSENISMLYKSIQDRFYSSSGCTILGGKYPYYSVDGSCADTVDHTYQMGLRRVPISKYGKEFSFLLPMWIDEECIDRLSFYAIVYPVSKYDSDTGVQPTPLTTKKLEMSERLSSYLKEWFSGITSDLAYIGIRERKAYIRGVDAENGSTITKDVSSVLDILLDRERPLMETDNIITRQFIENHMISKQLVNFNFLLNMADLFQPSIENTVMWNPVNIVVEARIDNEPVETKDIYTNYTDIYSYKISENPIHSGSFVKSRNDGDNIEYFNVLDYLDDTNCIDLVHKNKMVQPNFHWSFVDNPRYTWNLYNGFSPIVETEGTVQRVGGRFFGTPDVMSLDYSIYGNGIQWITVIDGTEDAVPGSFIGISMTASSTTRFAPNEFGSFWSKGIKYNISDTIERGYDGTDYPAPAEIRANICFVRDISTDHLDKDKIYAAVRRNKEGELGKQSFIDYVSIVAVTDGSIDGYWGLDKLTYQNVRRLISGDVYKASEDEKNDIFMMIDDDDPDKFIGLFTISVRDDSGELETADDDIQLHLLRTFGKVLDTIEYPSCVTFNKTLSKVIAPAPSIDKLVDDGSMDVMYTKESKYYMVDEDHTTNIFRYGGSVIPQFIDTRIEYEDSEETDGVSWTFAYPGPFNKVYRKRQWIDVSQNERNCLNYLSKQKYQPDYPSIGYFYIEGEVQDMDNPYVPENYYGEICWFFNNKVYFVPRQFTLVESNCTKESMDEKKMLEMFTSYVLENGYFKYMYNNGDENDRSVIIDTIERYIWKMYNHTSDWEYSSIDDIDLYDFKVTYSLI